MEFKLSKEDADQIAEAVVNKLLQGIKQPEKPHPLEELDNWIRAEDLYSRNLFTAPTIRKYHAKGLIGKSTIGGTVCYYIPDILNLLKMNYYKPEAVEKISDKLRAKTL